jgi:hypothetical protein
MSGVKAAQTQQLTRLAQASTRQATVPPERWMAKCWSCVVKRATSVQIPAMSNTIRSRERQRPSVRGLVMAG